MVILRFHVKKELLNELEQCVHPSEFEIESGGSSSYVTAVFLRRDHTSDGISDKIKEIDRILKKDPVNYDSRDIIDIRLKY